MISRLYPRTLALTLIPFLLSGCFVKFREGDVPAPRPSTVTTSQSIGVLVTGELLHKGHPFGSTPQLDDWSEWTLEAYRESGVFSEVTSSIDDSDVRAQVKITYDEEPYSFGQAFIGWLTAWLVPTKNLTRIQVEAEFIDSTGESHGSYEADETLTQWNHLFMIFVFPATNQFTIVKEAMMDLHLEILGQFGKDYQTRTHASLGDRPRRRVPVGDCHIARSRRSSQTQLGCLSPVGRRFRRALPGDTALSPRAARKSPPVGDRRFKSGFALEAR
jgi:hypothetical protein